MNNEELKKKIIEILEETEYEWTEEKNGYILQIFYDKLADALIAAGIGDLKEHRIFAGKDGSIKQLYSDEEVEDIARQRDEYKHRAERAERALKKLASFFAHNAKFLKDEREKERCQKTIFDDWINQAEEELAEGKKDKGEVKE